MLRQYHIFSFIKLGLLISLPLLLSCATTTQIIAQDRNSINNNYLSNTFFLKTSLYGGQFYDDDRFRLAHAKPFDQISDLTTLDGHVITPLPSDEIISVGTKVKIKNIEWPLGSVRFRRPLYSPRDKIWVILRVALERGNITFEREKDYILLAPDYLKNRQEFDAWFKSYFTKDNTNDWVLSLNTEIRNGILSKKAKKGMTYQELLATLGAPDQLKETKNKTINGSIATYGSTIVLIEDG